MEDKKMTVRAVERALDILVSFTRKPSLSLKEIVEITQLNKSTVHRLLMTLENNAFVQKDISSEKYSLGLRVWELSTKLDHVNDPAKRLLGDMERLRDKVEETVSLYIRDGLERIRVQSVESEQTIRRIAPVGARMPLYVGASGKVILAFDKQEYRERILADESLWQNRDIDDFRKQVDEIRQRGYAFSVEERESGTAAISVPIYNAKGKFIAALAVSGPVSRMSYERMTEYLSPILIRSSLDMSKKMVGF